MRCGRWLQIDSVLDLAGGTEGKTIALSAEKVGMRIAVPNKGRLHEPTVELLERAGLHIENGADRKLYAETVDPEVSILFARAADIPEYVDDGAAEVGITGLDQVHESESELSELLDLEYGRCRLVLATPEDGDITTPEQLEGKKVATEFPRIAAQYFKAQNIDVEIVEVTGATELTPHVEMADGIIDITSTGTTLAVNRLGVIDEVLSSSVRLFARDETANDEKVQQLVTALESVLAASNKRYLMMNVAHEHLDDVKAVIPGLGGPTVMDVAGTDDVAVHVVVDQQQVFEVINDLKSVGATGILVTEIERLVE
jgi:ATP phosphoribosyltransferase